MNLHTRQVRLYFPYSNRVRVLTDESIQEVEGILEEFFNQETYNFPALSGCIQHPNTNGSGWVVEHRWNQDQLLRIRNGIKHHVY